MDTVNNYEDKDAVKIAVDPDHRRDFAWEGWTGFEIVGQDEGESYKDSAPITTYLERLSDNTYWEFNWDKYTSHYGSGDHDFGNDPYLYKVNRTEKVVSQTVVSWDRVVT